jgi:dTDP-4-dehydrorhamnose 3,5-epimerase
MDKVNLIDGVILTPLKKIDHPLGNVYHGMKKSDTGFFGFEEAYFSTIIHGGIKPWKKHLEMTLNLMVPIGEIQFVIYDDREDSPTRSFFMEISISIDNYYRLTIPPKVWVAFKGIGESTNLLLNISNLEHNPNEMERIDLNAIKFNWKGK